MDHRSWNRALFCLCIFVGSGLATAKKSEKDSAVSSGGQWCVASQGASDKDLKVAIDWACGQGGADCTAIQPGANCYNPNTMRDHASYAFNDYYQKNPVPGSCVFGGTAKLTSTDPSTPNCHYASPGSSSGGPASGGQPSPPASGGQQSPPASGGQPSPAIPTPLAPSPPDMSGPSSSTSGTEPTGSPSAATSAFYSLPLLFISGLLATLQVPNYI